MDASNREDQAIQTGLTGSASAGKQLAWTRRDFGEDETGGEGGTVPTEATTVGEALSGKAEAAGAMLRLIERAVP